MPRTLLLRLLAAATSFASVIALPAAASPIDAPETGTPVAGLRPADPVPDRPENLGGLPAVAAWEGFQARYGKGRPLRGFFDLRTGRPLIVELSVPWMAGPANDLPPEPERSELEVLEERARDFVRTNRQLFGVAPDQLVLDRAASQPASPYETDEGTRYHLYHLVFDWVPYGVPVEGARVVFRINHGNLVQLATEKIGDLAAVPAPRPNDPEISAQEARELLLQQLPVSPGEGTAGPPPELRVLPFAAGDPEPRPGEYHGPPGQGIQYRLGWLVRIGTVGGSGSWRGAVDATTGEVLYWTPAGAPAYVYGEVLFNGASTPVSVVFPYVDFQHYLDPNGQEMVKYTNSQGYYDGAASSLVSTLSGLFIDVIDGCGNTGLADDNIEITGSPLDFGDRNKTTQECLDLTSAPKPKGNTLAARSTYYHATRGKMALSAYLPTNGWLASPTTAVTTHIGALQECNGGFDDYLPNTGGPALVFFVDDPTREPPNGHQCRNPGEIEGFVVHELGHGLDFNDGSNPYNYDFASAEANGDITAYLLVGDSCVARGFHHINKSGVLECGTPDYYQCSASCDGVREIDWRQHASPSPHRPLDGLQCDVPNADDKVCSDPNQRPDDCKAPGTLVPWTGPCGREGHCESGPATEAVYDLVQELETRGYTTTGALDKVKDLYFSSRPSGGQMFTCSATDGGATGGSLYFTLRAADDCDGDPTNGTPNAEAIFAALDLHGIAVGDATDPGNQNQNPSTPVADFTYSCSGGTCTFDGAPSTPASGIVQYRWVLGDGTVKYGKTVIHTYLDSSTYTVKLRVTDGCSQKHTRTKTVPVTVPAVDMAEVGLVTAISMAPVTVNLTHTFTDPVVFAQPLTYSDTGWNVPATSRVYDVQADRFTVAIERQGNPPNATSRWEGVYYLVVERGTWKLQGSGAVLRADTVATSASVGRFFADQWQSVSLGGAFLSPPIILSQVQTRNGFGFITTRQRNPSASGFEVAMEPFEWQSSPPAAETIGWLAMQPGQSTWSGANYRAATLNSVNSNWFDYHFVASCTSGWWHPRYLASLSSFNERHGHLRIAPKPNTQCTVRVMVQEDTTYDAETNHVNESVDFLVVSGTGILKAEPFIP